MCVGRAGQKEEGSRRDESTPCRLFQVDGGVPSVVFIIRGSSTAIDVVVWDRRVVYLKERVVDVQARRRSDRNFNLEFSLPLRIFFFFFFSLTSHSLVRPFSLQHSLPPFHTLSAKQILFSPPPLPFSFQKLRQRHLETNSSLRSQSLHFFLSFFLPFIFFFFLQNFLFNVESARHLSFEQTTLDRETSEMIVHHSRKERKLLHLRLTEKSSTQDVKRFTLTHGTEPRL